MIILESAKVILFLLFKTNIKIRGCNEINRANSYFDVLTNIETYY